MKRFIFLLTALLALPVMAGLQPGSKLEQLTTKSGKIYHGVTIKAVNPDGIRIMHSDGFSNIEKPDLPDDVATKLQFPHSAPVVPKAPSPSPPQKAPVLDQNREAKITSALILLGQAEQLGGASGGNVKEAFEQIRIAQKELPNKPLAEVLLGFAKSMSEGRPNQTFEIAPTEMPTFKAVRDILGQPDSSKQGKATVKDVQVVWAQYGWCSFGVSSGNVIVVRVDCKLLPP